MMAGTLAAALVYSQLVQAQTSRLEFEVASIKRNISSGGSIFAGCHERGGDRVPPGRCILRRASLMWVIAEAYGFRAMQADQWLKGAPGWAKSERYDIEAKAEDDNASPDDLKLMLRN